MDIATKTRRPWQQVLSMGVLVAGVTALVVKRNLVGDVCGEFGAMRLSAALVLLGLAIVHRVLNSMMHRSAVPGVRLGNVMMAAEAYTGASHSFAGGAGVGTALRVAMFRSWGVSGTRIATAIVATSVFPSFAMWLLGGAHTIPLLLSGRADRNETMVGFASLVFLGGPIAFWSFVLGHPSAVSQMQRSALALRRVAKRVRSRRVRTFLCTHIDSMNNCFVDMRKHGSDLVRRNGAQMLLGAVGSQLALMLILLASASALAPTVDLPMLEIARAFALLRVMSSFVPVPGGIGIVDVGLVATLESASLTSSQAIAAVALYRSLTFVLPLMTGPICALVWWRRVGKRHVLESAAEAERASELAPQFRLVA